MGNVHGRTDSMNANAEALLLGSHLVIINTLTFFFASLFSSFPCEWFSFVASWYPFVASWYPFAASLYLFLMLVFLLIMLHYKKKKEKKNCIPAFSC